VLVLLVWVLVLLVWVLVLLLVLLLLAQGLPASLLLAKVGSPLPAA
jgi:hypothetical protein